MIEQRAILLLGGSAQQVVAIEKAKALGFRTVLCDYLPDNPGHKVADKAYLTSTTNREGVLEVARAERVEGVLAYASDPAAPTAAYVAEALELPTNPLESVEVLSQKHLFRKYLFEHGFNCPRAVSFAITTTSDEVAALLECFTWPVVVKPTDSSGSKGVSIVASPDELASALDVAAKKSRNGVLIAEEYIERDYPSVIGGDIFVVGGEVVFWGLMDCLRDSLADGLVPVGKAMPSGIALQCMASCKTEIQRLVEALGIRFGEFNVEIIVGSGGRPFILELGARAGGNMIPVQLSDASGIDLIAANVLCAMGENPGNLTWDGQESGVCCAHYVLHSREDGILNGVEIPEFIEQCVYRKVPYLAVGDEVQRFDGADKALGIIFMKFDKPEMAQKILACASDAIQVVLR